MAQNCSKFIFTEGRISNRTEIFTNSSLVLSRLDKGFHLRVCVINSVQVLKQDNRFEFGYLRG